MKNTKVFEIMKIQTDENENKFIDLKISGMIVMLEKLKEIKCPSIETKENNAIGIKKIKSIDYERQLIINNMPYTDENYLIEEIL